MSHHRHAIEQKSNKDTSDETSKQSSEKLLKESNQKSDIKRTDSDPAAQKFVDQNLPQADKVIDTQEKPERLEWDANGNPSKYTDRNGDVIERREDGGYYRVNAMSPKGEKLKDFHVDKDGTVNITYDVPKDENDKSKGFNNVTKQVRMDGTEVVKYPEGTSTETVRNGDQKTVTVKNESGNVVQSLQYKGMELQQLNASDGTKYVRNADGNGWTKFNADGTQDNSFATNDKFAVKADANGNAVVRNANFEFADNPDSTIVGGVREPLKYGQGGEKYATRYYPDGTIVHTSSEKDSPRDFYDPTGTHKAERKFDTYVQEMPDNWKELLQQRRQEAAQHPYLLNNDPNTLLFLYNKTVDKGDWDDKQNGGQYQAWGNAAWGVYAAETGLPEDEAIWWNGAVKTVNRKNAGKDWGSPLDWYTEKRKDSTFGQNPADADLIKEGYKLQAKLSEEDGPKEPTVMSRLVELKKFVESCRRYTYGPFGDSPVPMVPVA